MPKRSKGSQVSKKDGQDEWKKFYEDYEGNVPNPEELKMSKNLKSFSFKLKNSDSVITDRSHRNKPAKCRAKVDTIKWDGLSHSFRSFKRAIEGHLIQVGAGYLTQPQFVETYKETGKDFLISSAFWSLYKVSMAQALYDREYLYGILLTATMKLQQKTIIKYEHNLKGI